MKDETISIVLPNSKQANLFLMALTLNSYVSLVSICFLVFHPTNKALRLNIKT